MSTIEKLGFVAAGFAMFAFTIAFAVGFQSHVNSAYKKPTNVRVTDADLPGQVIVSWSWGSNTWNLVAYTTKPELQAAIAEGQNWTEVLTSVETQDASYRGVRISNLEPSTRYAFIVGRLPGRDRTPIWSDWVYHTTPDARSYPNELRTPPSQPHLDQDGSTPHPLQPPDFIRPGADTQ